VPSRVDFCAATRARSPFALAGRWVTRDAAADSRMRVGCIASASPCCRMRDSSENDDGALGRLSMVR
jgi:hypothetical protein